MIKHEGAGNIKSIFNLFMALFYCLCGASLLFAPQAQKYISDGVLRTIFGAILALYGIFRVYQWKNQS